MTRNTAKLTSIAEGSDIQMNASKYCYRDHERDMTHLISNPPPAGVVSDVNDFDITIDLLTECGPKNSMRRTAMDEQRSSFQAFLLYQGSSSASHLIIECSTLPPDHSQTRSRFLS